MAMDRGALEEKVAALLRDIEKMPDSEKRKHLADFIAKEIEKSGSPFLLDRHDIQSVTGVAINYWRDMPLNKKIGGLPMDSEMIKTVCYLHAIVSLLRQYHLLDRVIDVKFDPDYRS